MKQKLSLFLLLSIILVSLAPLKVSAAVTAGITGDSLFSSPYLQSKGSMGVLVVPVQFDDVKFEDDAESNLEEVFRGSGTADAPSVKSYFDIASYGSLYLDVIVQRPVTLHPSRSAYENNLEGMIEDALDIIVEYREVNLYQFDENYDGYFDALYFVFAGDVGANGSFWWPHTETYFNDFEAGGVQIAGCSFLSYEMLMNGTVLEQYTAIHETGHLLGLTDYYASGTASGTGADVMMDRNKGDEDCFSKMLLGWTVPQTTTASGTFSLESESVTSDALIIAPPTWDGNILSEYFMVEYVTPEANQSVHDLPEEGAIRVWHVNAATSTFTNDITSDMFKADNQSQGAKLLQIVNPSVQWYAPGSVIDSSDLKYVNGSDSGIQIRFDAVEDGEAQLTVTYASDGATGESSESSETSESSEASESSSEAESSDTSAETSESSGSSEQTGSSENGSDEGENESTGSAETSAETSGESQSENEESTASASEESSSSRFSVTTEEASDMNMENGDVQPRRLTPAVGIAIVLVFVLCYFLLRDSSKHRTKPRRRKRRGSH